MEKRVRPLLSDEEIDDAAHGSEIGFWYNWEGKSHPDMPATFSQGAMYARHDYEEHLTKQDALIERLLNDMQDFVDKVDRREAKSKRSYYAFKHSIEIAKEAGFTPTVTE